MKRFAIVALCAFAFSFALAGCAALKSAGAGSPTTQPTTQPSGDHSLATAASNAESGAAQGATIGSQVGGALGNPLLGGLVGGILGSAVGGIGTLVFGSKKSDGTLQVVHQVAGVAAEIAPLVPGIAGKEIEAGAAAVAAATETANKPQS
jgi:predicted lipid-binding transport protein (Tim44 family)